MVKKKHLFTLDYGFTKIEDLWISDLDKLPMFYSKITTVAYGITTIKC